MNVSKPHSDRRAEAWSRIDTTKTEDMVPSSELRGWLAEYVGLFEQLEALRQALRDSWDDYAIAIDDHASEEVRAEARHHMLRRFVAFQDEGWLASSPATRRCEKCQHEAHEPGACGENVGTGYQGAVLCRCGVSDPATKPYVRPADDPHTLVAKALAPDPAKERP